jgi:hypothetical protein
VESHKRKKDREELPRDKVSSDPEPAHVQQHVNGSGTVEDPSSVRPPAATMPGIPKIDLPPGRLNAEAYTAMNYGLGGNSFATPLQARQGPVLSMRTFRAAAQAAVARVASRVTPPNHFTPGNTPRATPRDGRGATPRDRGQDTAQSQRAGRVESLREPMLRGR